MIKKSDGIQCVYIGETYQSKALPVKKYPIIQQGDKGVVIERHPWEIEKYPHKPFAFYPAKWGYIYFFSVSIDQIQSTKQITLFERR